MPKLKQKERDYIIPPGVPQYIWFKGTACWFELVVPATGDVVYTGDKGSPPQPFSVLLVNDS